MQEAISVYTVFIMAKHSLTAKLWHMQAALPKLYDVATLNQPFCLYSVLIGTL